MNDRQSLRFLLVSLVAAMLILDGYGIWIICRWPQYLVTNIILSLIMLSCSICIGFFCRYLWSNDRTL